MNRIIPLILLIGLCWQRGYAQLPDSTTLEQLKLAIRLLKGIRMEQDKDSAFVIFKHLSDTGDATALNAMGNCYAEGIGTDKDLQTARKYYEQAAKGGYAKAHYNLAMIYKYGKGVKINYERAYKELEKSQAKGYEQASYGLGYFHYKGIGTTQDYEQAVAWFRRGIELVNSSSCRYMLGLCYRNGYGVSVDKAEARKLIMESMISGNPLAGLEMHESLSEIEQGAGTQTIPRDSVEAMAAYRGRFNYQGIWQGTKLTYDYSHQYVIRQEPITLQLTEDGTYVSGHWQQDTINIEVEGTLSNGSLYLLRQSYGSRVRYDRKVSLSIEQSTLSPHLLGDDHLLLAGEVREYNTSFKEPAHPTYLILTRPVIEGELADANEESMSTENWQAGDFTEADIAKVFDVERGLEVYPNPYGTRFRVGFTMKSRARITIQLVHLSGLVEEVLLDDAVLDAGDFDYRGGEQASPDTYLLRIFINGIQAEGRLIVKI